MQAGKHLEGIQSEPCPVGACFSFTNSDTLNSKWQIITLLLSLVKYLPRAASENFRSACCQGTPSWLKVGWWWWVVACEIILSSPGTGGTFYFPFPFSHFPFPIPIPNSQFPIPIPISSPQSPIPGPGPGPVPVA